MPQEVKDIPTKIRYSLVLLRADKVKNLDDILRLQQEGKLDEVIIRQEEWIE